LSTWSCTGLSDTALDFAFTGGLRESCLYIDNISAVQHAFFVPMRTEAEWLAFKAATLSNGTLENKVEINYGCLADDTLTDSCENAASVPAARHGASVSIDTSSIMRATFMCEATNGCGNWVRIAEEGTCKKDGVCGAAHGQKHTAAPATDLCATGTARAVSRGATWNWVCAGIAGGADATCAAEVKPALPPTGPVTITCTIDAGLAQTLKVVMDDGSILTRKLGAGLGKKLVFHEVFESQPADLQVVSGGPWGISKERYSGVTDHSMTLETEDKFDMDYNDTICVFTW
jgi:hypothetical protein